MCFAACDGDDAAIQKLLAKGVSPNVSDYDRRTALHIAAAEGNLSTVQLLISAGADVLAKDRWGHTPIDGAHESTHKEIMAALRTAGTNNGDMPCGQHGTLEPKSSATSDSDNKLLLVGLEPELTELDSSPPLSPRFDTHEVHLLAGMRMCCAAAADNAPIIRQLVAGGISINAADYDGRAALHVAALYGHCGLARELLALRADVNCKDHFGSTALSAAVSHNQEEVAAVLLKARQDRGDGRLAATPTLTGQRDSGLANWMIQEKEVQFGPVLSTTLKSAIHVAEWRGMKVVAKTLLTLRCSKDSLSSGEDGIETKEVLHEIGLLSTMRHPDLVMFLGACIDNPQPFFIMEFMEGGDLERHFMQKTRQLGRRYKPNIGRFLKWSSAVARALCFLHNCSAPVIHRDLKPLNLLLTKNSELKVTDFGISKLMWSRTDKGDRARRMSGGVGTWRYMAPEVVRAEQYTDRVDVYSFALIMWFMSSGLQPFEELFGTDAELVLKDYLRGNEPRPTFGSHAGLLSSSKATPGALRRLVENCWHRRAGARPSAHQCTQRLVEIASQAEQSTWSALFGKAE